MAAVPFPLMVRFHGEKTRRPLVFDSLRESEKHSIVQIPDVWTVRGTLEKGKLYCDLFSRYFYQKQISNAFNIFA